MHSANPYSKAGAENLPKRRASLRGEVGGAKVEFIYFKQGLSVDRTEVGRCLLSETQFEVQRSRPS